MKYMKRKNIWKGSNVSFNPETIEGTSYNWWSVVRKFGDKVVFNNYSYSITTSRHQSKIRLLLHKLNIDIDLTIQSPKGLQNLDSAMRYHQAIVDHYTLKMNQPRTHKKKNKERFALKARHCRLIEEIKSLKNEGA